MVVCAGYNESFCFARSVGVGLVNSAINLTKMCAQEDIKSLVFIGSAGAYDQNADLLSIFVSDSTTQIELGFLQQYAYTPLDNRIDSGVLESPAIHKIISQWSVSCETKIEKAIVNSSNYITTNIEFAKRYAQADILLENMEFFAVMSVAQYFQIPCMGIFCVSNYCDENAHQMFVTHHDSVKSTLTKHKDKIQSLASALEEICKVSNSYNKDLT